MKREKIRSTKSILLFALLVFIILSTGCATNQSAQKNGATIIAATKPVAKYVRSDIDYPIDAYDPWECFNRRMYIFNYYFDKYLFLPVVGAYEWVMPDYLEDRISGVFKNLGELRNFTNNLLQLKGKGTMITTGRVLVNSTIGLAGMYDPANTWNLPVQKEDFGQTLGHYGVGAGPFLVLPIFGPSTLRDTTGLVFDTAVHTAVMNWALDDVNNKNEIKLGINLLGAIDERHRTPFRYYQSGSPFEYEYLRKLYLEKRIMDIAK